jgi:hypothetical protein
MHWNYRIIRHDDDKHSWFGLHEVFYDGSISGWTENPITFVCDADEGTEGITDALNHALKDALEHPFLIESELPGGKKDEEH